MTPEYVRALAKEFTKAESKSVIDATIDHICNGTKQAEAAEKAGVQQSAVGRLASRLRKIDISVAKVINVR